jgi:hypothetical protein
MKRGSRAGKSRLFKFLLILIVALAAVGCGPPIGDIGGYGDTDLLWTVPNRVAYDLNDLFMRNSDYQVFVSYRGVIQYVPNEKVKVSIAEDPDFSEEREYIPLDENYALRTQGRKLVVVEYGEMSADYSIEVRNQFGMGDNGGNENSGSGIIIEWETPVNLLP